MTKSVKKLDCSRMSCPKPIIEFSKFVLSMKKGEILEMLVDDNETIKDIPKWCEIKNCELINIQNIKDNKYKITIKKG